MKLLNIFHKTLKNMKKDFFGILKVTEDFGADPEPLVRDMDPDPHPDPYQNVTDPEHCGLDSTEFPKAR